MGFSKKIMLFKKVDLRLLITLIAILGIGGALVGIFLQNSTPSTTSLHASATHVVAKNGLELKTFFTPKATPTPTPTSTPIPTPTPQPTPTQEINGIKLGWSSGYYVGWMQGTYPPQTLPWQDFTYIIHFSLTTNRNGSLNYTHGMTPTFMQQLVAEAHKHNVKELLSIGGDDDQNWNGACSSASRTTFVTNLVTTMQTYGYDGLDLDIEQDFGYPTYTDYIACVQQLRSALNKIAPQPLLTMAVDPSWQAYQASHVWQYVDRINMMSYGADANAMGNLINNFTSRGFPSNRLGIGIDFVADANAPWCGGLAQYAVNNGVGGIMEWDFTEDASQHNGQTPCLDAISPYVPAH